MVMLAYRHMKVIFVVLLMTCWVKISANRKSRIIHKICKDGSVVHDKCGQRCICNNGKITQCCRERKDFTSMTHEERRRYVNTMLKASTNKKYEKKYRDLITIHKTFFEEGIHKARQFLPWHRWYLLHFENFMRTIDCKFTVPYWDWSYYRDDPFSEKYNDIWSSEDHGLGGNGRENDNCVITGPFSINKWRVHVENDSMCLQREFNSTMTLPSLAFLENPPEDFSDFEFHLRSEIHDYVHDMICGHMCSVHASADPFFWMHHGFVDKLWDEWQRKSHRHKFAYYLTDFDDKPMVANNLTPILFMDSMELPGGVSVCYVDTQHDNKKREIFKREEINTEKRPNGEYILNESNRAVFK